MESVFFPKPNINDYNVNFFLGKNKGSKNQENSRITLSAWQSSPSLSTSPHSLSTSPHSLSRSSSKYHQQSKVNTIVIKNLNHHHHQCQLNPKLNSNLVIPALRWQLPPQINFSPPSLSPPSPPSPSSPSSPSSPPSSTLSASSPPSTPLSQCRSHRQF